MSIGIATAGMFSYVKTIETIVDVGMGGGGHTIIEKRPTVRVSGIKLEDKDAIKIGITDVREV